MGPTLAAVGVSFLLPLIAPKSRDFPISKDLKKELLEKGITLGSASEQKLIDWIWILIFVTIGIWTYSLFLSSSSQIVMWFGFPSFLILGLINYFVGVLFSELKEVV